MYIQLQGRLIGLSSLSATAPFKCLRLADSMLERHAIGSEPLRSREFGQASQEGIRLVTGEFFPDAPW
jgi:hypothetical protein